MEIINDNKEKERMKLIIQVFYYEIERKKFLLYWEIKICLFFFFFFFQLGFLDCWSWNNGWLLMWKGEEVGGIKGAMMNGDERCRGWLWVEFMSGHVNGFTVKEWGDNKKNVGRDIYFFFICINVQLLFHC